MPQSLQETVVWYIMTMKTVCFIFLLFIMTLLSANPTYKDNLSPVTFLSLKKETSPPKKNKTSNSKKNIILPKKFIKIKKADKKAASMIKFATISNQSLYNTLVFILGGKKMMTGAKVGDFGMGNGFNLLGLWSFFSGVNYDQLKSKTPAHVFGIDKHPDYVTVAQSMYGYAFPYIKSFWNDTDTLLSIIKNNSPHITFETKDLSNELFFQKHTKDQKLFNAVLLRHQEIAVRGSESFMDSAEMINNIWKYLANDGFIIFTSYTLAEHNALKHMLETKTDIPEKVSQNPFLDTQNPYSYETFVDINHAMKTRQLDNYLLVLNKSGEVKQKSNHIVTAPSLDLFLTIDDPLISSDFACLTSA